MDRLTERNTLGEALLNANLNEKYEQLELIDILLDRLAAYEDTGLSPEEAESTKAALMGKSLAEIKELNGISLERMIELAKAEAEGRLVVLPSVKVFVLQYVRGNNCDDVCPVRINGLGCCDLCDKSELGICEERCEQRHLERIGKTVFLTHKEAEKALEAQRC